MKEIEKMNENKLNRRDRKDKQNFTENEISTIDKLNV